MTMPLFRITTLEERAAFLDRIASREILTSGNFPDEEHPIVLSLVFPMIADEIVAAGLTPETFGGAFQECCKNTGSVISVYTGHTYPIFDGSCYVVRVDDWLEMANLYDAIKAGKATA